jgi:hypothetical protein
MGLVVVICHKRIERWHHDEHLRRSHRYAAYRQGCLRRWDFRAERFVTLVIGLGVILVGLVCLVAKRWQTGT